MTDEGLRRVAVVVEDDADIRNLLEAVLTQAGFNTHTASDGLDGVEKVRTHDPVVTTLDISLPGIDGFEVARRIRAFSSTYIVMLTARNEEIDTLVGLDAGADDYLTKPFRPRELRARIEAMLRRPRTAQNASDAQTAPSAPSESAADAVIPAPALDLTPAASAARSAEAAYTAGAAHDDWIERSGLRLSAAMRLVEVDNHRVELTKTEFELLNCIMSNGRRVVSKSTLATAIRADDYATVDYVSDSDRRAIEVHLANLRRKLGDSSAQPRWIETVRGVGYRLAEPSQR
jgi:two-component system, OmpR family, response regulator